MNSRHSNDDPEVYRRFAKPPNYFSRRIQLRLLMLVSMLMLVIVAMEEARDPKYYAWMWGQQPETRTEEEVEVQTELPPRPQTPEPAVPDAIRTQQRPDPLDAQVVEAAAAATSDPLERSKFDAWAAVLDAISISEQMQIRAAIYASRQRRQLDAEEKRRLSPALNKVIDAWKTYIADAEASLVSEETALSEEDRAAWTAVLRKLELHWTKVWRPAFEAMFQDRDLFEQERESFAALQEILDRLALAAVQDNTVLRNDEQGAWFRLLELLQQKSDEELTSDDSTAVGFLQLYKQPQDYRGKLVTFRGVTRLAYRVRAPRNALGIEEYNILWVKPRGGPNSPCVVYSLETPPGFPELKSKDRDQETSKLDVDVTVTGYFFKNWAYRSKGGINVAPLVLIKSPVMNEAPAATASPYSTKTLLIVAGGMAALAILIAGVVYLLHSWPSRASSYYTSSNGDRLQPPNEEEIRDDVLSALRQLEQGPPRDGSRHQAT